MRAAHFSLYHGANPNAVADGISRRVEAHRLDLFTTTEAQQKNVAALVRKKLGKDYTVTHRNEYLVVTRKEVWKRRSPSRIWKVTTRSKNHLPDWRQTEVLVLSLTHRPSKKKVRVMVAHLPSGVELGASWRKGGPVTRGAVAAHQEATRRWGAKIQKALKRGKVTQIAAMDANLDYSRKEWRDHMEAQLGMKSVWHVIAPNRGTHGSRVIDVAHTDAEVENAHVLSARIPGVDHYGFIYVLNL